MFGKMNDRLNQFLSAENISNSQFADTLGVAKASVSHILNGRNKPSFDFIQSVIEHYPALNIEWLLAGKGKMYKGLSNDRFQPEPPAAVTENDVPEPENLFSQSASEPSPAVSESDISPRQAAAGRNTAATEGNMAVQSPVQTAEHQRNITRIIVFFDDNTFQEIGK